MSNPKLWIAGLMFAAACAAAPARALEVSLEENKAERGNIGFVDIKKVYRLYPETHKAKKSYLEIVRQAEEQVNLRRARLLTLRADLAKLKLERDLLEKKPLPAPPLPPPPVSTSTAPAAPPEVSTGATEGLLLLPGMSKPLESEIIKSAQADPETAPTLSTAAASVPPAPVEKKEKPEPLIINIPGVTDQPIVVSEPSGMPEEEKVPPEPEPEKTPVEPAAAPEPAAASMTAYLETVALRHRRLEELKKQIRSSKAALDLKEAEFRKYQAAIEKNLIEIESRRSEILLGKIYRAVKTVARESGVSVVVDKNQILFGQNSVDLTQRVIYKLQELPL